MIHPRQPRFSHQLAMRYSTGDGDPLREACTLDLSVNGLFLRTRHVLPEGTHVLGCVDFPDGKTAEVHGVVAWTRTEAGAAAEICGEVGLRLLWADSPYFEFLARATHT